VCRAAGPGYVGDGSLGDERKRLRQETDHSVDADRSRGGPVLAGNQLEQRALSGAIGRDEAGAAVADGEGQVLE